MKFSTLVTRNVANWSADLNDPRSEIPQVESKPLYDRRYYRFIQNDKTPIINGGNKLHTSHNVINVFRGEGRGRGVRGDRGREPSVRRSPSSEFRKLTTIDFIDVKHAQIRWNSKRRTLRWGRSGNRVRLLVVFLILSLLATQEQSQSIAPRNNSIASKNPRIFKVLAIRESVWRTFHKLGKSCHKNTVICFPIFDDTLL